MLYRNQQKFQPRAKQLSCFVEGKKNVLQIHPEVMQGECQLQLAFVVHQKQTGTDHDHPPQGTWRFSEFLAPLQSSFEHIATITQTRANNN